MPKIYRILRIMEYTGTLEFINMQKIKDTVKGTHSCNGNIISSSYIGKPTEVKQSNTAEES
jgi:hypothetical protein